MGARKKTGMSNKSARGAVPRQCLGNAIVHPDLKYYDNMVRRQALLVSFKEKIQQSRDKYREGTTGATRDRFDARAVYDDILAGKHPTLQPSDIEQVKELIEARFSADHKFTALGVELSPGKSPMLEGNILVKLDEGHGIDEAVALAKKHHYPLVSTNVWGQLSQAQRNKCEDLDNIHQYAVEPKGRVFDKNPTGYYANNPEDAEFGITYLERPGVKRHYHFQNITLDVELTEMVLPQVTIDVGENCDEFTLGTGRFIVSCNGLRRVSDLPSGCAGMTEVQVRHALENFRLRDAKGKHADDDFAAGPVSKKVDGLFCMLDCAKGQATFRFRSGRTYLSQVGACDTNITAAFELVNFDGNHGELYCLYVDKLRGNRWISMRKEVQDHLRTLLDLKFHFKSPDGDWSATTVGSCDSLPSDGIVVWTGDRQIFYKENNTVEITKNMARVLSEQHGIIVKRADEMDPNRIYSFRTANEPVPCIQPPDGPLVPLGRDEKVLPNKINNVIRAIRSPTLQSLKAYHRVSHPGQKCEVCASF